jgi:hypothetical protein
MKIKANSVDIMKTATKGGFEHVLISGFVLNASKEERLKISSISSSGNWNDCIVSINIEENELEKKTNGSKRKINPLIMTYEEYE